MNYIQVIGGIKGEMKSETQNSAVEIGLDDIFDDDSDESLDPFDIDNSGDELVHANLELKQTKNVKTDISQLKNVSETNCNTNLDTEVTINRCKDVIKSEIATAVKTKVNAQFEEKLVLNFTKNEDLLDGNRKNEIEEAEKNSLNTNIDWSGAYRTIEGTSTKEDNAKVKVTLVPTSYVASHEYTVEGLDKYRCNHCQFITKCKRWVTKHIRYIHRDVTKTYQCPYCPFKSKYPLKYHIISMHKSESELEWFKCGKCDYKSKLKTTLTNHLLSHMDPNEIMDRMKKCDKCSKMFKFSKGLQRHKLFVHEKHTVEKLKCAECHYECLHAFQLRDHKEAVHSDRKNLETLRCPKCSYKTKLKHNFTRHVYKHRYDKITCEKCAYQTDIMQKMRLHMINHKEVKDDEDLKYRCDKCDYKTYRLYSLQVHKLNHLKPEEIQYFYCYHCEFKAKRKDNLKTHVLRHFKHNEVPFQCFICDFKTKKRDILSRHITKHSTKAKESKNLKIETILPIDAQSKQVNNSNNNPETKVSSPVDKQSKTRRNLKTEKKKNFKTDIISSIDLPLNDVLKLETKNDSKETSRPGFERVMLKTPKTG